MKVENGMNWVGFGVSGVNLGVLLPQLVPLKRENEM
jgi:hypothetical protein